MRLDDITPMVLTFNEEANLARTLNALSWAKQILVVDSYSTDGTLEIAEADSRVRVVQRPFDHFADQCNHGLSQIQTDWILSLDADYVCDQGLGKELEQLDAIRSGYQAHFLYGVYGYPLRTTLYPPRVVLYRRDKATYYRDGHAHRVSIQGEIGCLRSTILHDDRKPLACWFQSQIKYAQLEADKLLESRSPCLGWKERLRKRIIFAAPLTLLYCLFARGLVLDGWRGVYYALQRSLAELLLSLTLLDRRLRG